MFWKLEETYDRKCMFPDFHRLTVTLFKEVSKALESSVFTDHIFLILEAKLLEFTSQQVHHIFLSVQQHSIAFQE